MKKRHFLVFIILIIIFTTNGCRKDEQGAASLSNETLHEKNIKEDESPAVLSETTDKESLMVAIVNGKVITQSEMDKEIQNLIQQVSKNVPHDKIENLRPMLKRHALDNLINQTLLMQKVEEEGIVAEENEVDLKIAEITKQFGSEEEFQKRMKTAGFSMEELRNEVAKGLQIEGLLGKEISKIKDVTDAEVKNFYNDNPDKFQEKEQIRASHILIGFDPNGTEEGRTEKRQLAESLKKEIDSGTDFAELASKYSDCPSRFKGGDLGFFERGKMVPSFEDVAFSLEKGEVSNIVETQYGYHIIKLTDHKDSQAVPLEQTKEKIRNYLVDKNKQDVIKGYIEGLRSDAKIEYTDNM